MIKLFLITLLCVAVLADSPLDEFNKMAQAGKEIVDEAITAGQAIMGQASSLVRRAANEPPNDGQGPPRGPPPQSNQDQQQ